MCLKKPQCLEGVLRGHRRRSVAVDPSPPRPAQEREFLFSHFLETKTQPKLFFLPAHHTPATKKRLEERKSASATKYQVQEALCW